MALTFEGDPAKARSNLANHGVDFPEAATVFADFLSLTVPDPDQSKGEPAAPRGGSKKPMKKEPEQPAVGEMREEYDFSNAVRAKYAARFAEGSNVVVLDPDVAAAFPDAKAVNDALREIAGLE